MYSWVCLTFWISILKITSQRKIIRSNPINSSPLLISCSSAVAVLWLQRSETLTKEAENRKQVQFPKAIEPSSSHRRAGWEDAPGRGVSLANDVFHWNFEEKKKRNKSSLLSLFTLPRQGSPSPDGWASRCPQCTNNPRPSLPSPQTVPDQN